MELYLILKLKRVFSPIDNFICLQIELLKAAKQSVQQIGTYGAQRDKLLTRKQLTQTFRWTSRHLWHSISVNALIYFPGTD